MLYDYIIVGSGSAGAVLASRLATQTSYQVLLIEAGGEDELANIHIPATFPSLFNSDVDWAYSTEPQSHCHRRQDFWPRGKVLGGSSSINAMIYQRGHPEDYNEWQRLGNSGWSWPDVLPYFKKSQHQERGESFYHGVGGPLNVADLRDPHPLSMTFLAACKEQGLPLNLDFNGATQQGFGLYQVTQKQGARCSVTQGYLHPIRHLDNFHIMTDAHVTQLIIDQGRCLGVRYQKNQCDHEAMANREVIVCAGSIGSPQLLMLSGIGDQQALQPLGITMHLHLPGVGKNLQDHLMAPVAFHCRKPISLASAASKEQVHLYQSQARGMLSSNIGEAGGFIKLNSQSLAPELQFHFAPNWFINHGLDNPEGHGITLLPSLVGTMSRGDITLNTNDPFTPPKINPNYLSVDDEIKILISGVKLARKIMYSQAFDSYRGEEYLPGEEVTTDPQLKEFIRDHVQCIYHPVGTCKMGQDQSAVVNDQLCVHGIQGLRVADASIMPKIINANTNAACIMIGEKCADLVITASAQP